MPELTTPAPLCDARGRLATRGWARRPIIDGNLSRAWLRKKRWEYWCVVGAEHLFALTIADVDYFGLLAASLCELRTGRWRERVALLPPGRGPALTSAVGGDVEAGTRRLALAVRHQADGAHLTAQARGLSAALVIAPAEESLSVVVPWSARRFQLTCKQVGLPARGEVVWDGVRARFDGGWGCLDFGRGVWPYRTRWQWAAAAGNVAGRRVAFNLGGSWTDGSGANENALFVDGRLIKLGDVRFDADGIRGDAVALRFAAERPPGRRLALELGLMAARLDWRFGVFDGHLGGHAVAGLRGWSEDVSLRW